MASGFLVFLGATILGTMVHLIKDKTETEIVEFLDETPALKWIPVIGLLLFFLGYQLGYISVLFILLGELLPSNARDTGSFIVVQFSNISFFLAVKSANVCQETLGLDGLFWLFAGVAIFSIVFAYLFIPETFGKSLEDIEEHYRKICYPAEYRTDIRKIEVVNKSFVEEYGQ